jgi:hypothetical protein
MARYNSALASATITGTHTISSPSQGAFTNLTGTAPYTVTLPNPTLFPGSNQTFHNATGGTVTLSTPSGILTGTGGSNASTVPCFAGNVLSVTSDGTNYVVISEDGSALVATTGLFSSNLTVNGGVTSFTPSNFSVAPASLGAMDNISIGATTRAGGSFTNLSANAAVAFTANTASTTTGTGSLVVTGGVGVSGQVTATSVSATNLIGTVQTAAQPNITSTGALTVPSLTSTGNILVQAATTASAGSIQITSIDAAIRLKWTTSPVADKNTWDIRSVGTGTTPFLQFRTINDANTVFTDRVAFTNDGNVGINTTTPDAKLVINLRHSAENQGIPTTSGTASTAGLRIKAGDAGQGGYGETLDFGMNVSSSGSYGWIQPTNWSGLATNYALVLNPNGGNVGIGTTNFSAGYTFNVAKRARFNGMMLGNGDGSTASDNRILFDWSSGSLAQIVAQQNVPLYLGVGGTTKVFVDSAGHWMPVANDSQNLGSASLAWANLYTNDLHLCNETKVNGNDVDGTTGNWTIQEGAENLYIINNKTGKKFAFALREIE